MLCDPLKEGGREATDCLSRQSIANICLNFLPADFSTFRRFIIFIAFFHRP